MFSLCAAFFSTALFCISSFFHLCTYACVYMYIHIFFLRCPCSLHIICITPLHIKCMATCAEGRGQPLANWRASKLASWQAGQKEGFMARASVSEARNVHQFNFSYASAEWEQKKKKRNKMGILFICALVFGFWSSTESQLPVNPWMASAD